MLLKRCLTIAFMVALAGGCGGLRQLPVTGNDAGPGAGGSAAGAAGRGGAGGTTGTGGGGGSVVGGAGGSANPDGGGSDAPSCVAGGACVPNNPCHKGQFVCGDAGTMTCMELTDLQANGTVCGTDLVCHNGSCDSCIAGMACDVSGRPCRVGSIVCTTGVPVCTETDNKPNGTGCGTGMVCQNGTCAACQANTSCQPTNKCHNGTQVCTPSVACMDANTNVAAGTSCGTDMVCDGSGTCASCMAGMDCSVPGKPCSKGTVACNTGRAVCIESGNAPNGTVCGNGMVCSNGTCAACSAGSACQPANPCHGGITVCAPNIGCTDTGNALTNGVSCGTDKVCNAGTCVTCAASSSCQPQNACKTGTTSCATGSPVCVESGNQPNGTTCGNGMVCNGGSCAACSGGGSCVPANPCHTGTLTCSTGTSTCSDTGTNAADGTSCGANLVCRSGSCVSCTANQPCQPQNPCKNGTTSCATGASTCVESGNKTPGTLCGAGQSCANGVLTLPAMCSNTGTCAAATMQCQNGCNSSGTDCATCPNGQTSCADGCHDLTRDPMNCGGCATPCPAPSPSTGIPVCINSSCDIQCNAGYLACSPPSIAICQQTVWDFEDGNIEGFRVLNTPTAVSGKMVAQSAAVASGKYALGIPIDAGNSTSRGFQVGPPICASRGQVIAKGSSVTAVMLIQPSGNPPALGKATYFGIRLVTENSPDGVIVKFQPPAYGQWFKISTPMPANDVQLISFAVEGVFATDVIINPADWIGAVYLDDVTIQ
jgi:hypothetical protein